MFGYKNLCCILCWLKLGVNPGRDRVLTSVSSSVQEKLAKLFVIFVVFVVFVVIFGHILF